MKEDIYRSLTDAEIAENAVHVARYHAYVELQSIAKHARMIKPRNLPILQDILNETSILIHLDEDLMYVNSFIEVYPAPLPHDFLDRRRLM